MLLACVPAACSDLDEKSDLEVRLDEKYLLNRDYEGAIEFLGKYADTSGADPDALLQLGIMLLKVGRHEEAAGAFERAMEKEPDDPFPVAWLARVKTELGKFDEGAELQERALYAGAGGVRHEI